MDIKSDKTYEEIVERLSSLFEIRSRSDDPSGAKSSADRRDADSPDRSSGSSANRARPAGSSALLAKNKKK